jgi:methylglutaconyl-CoA hydratase
MTRFETISITTDARGVATLELAHEDKHNALSAQMMVELTKAAALLGDDPEVRVVVITGRGASFCAGGDLKWMREQMAGGTETRRAAAYKLSNMLRAINTIPKPVIARVQGIAFGGGVGIISVCDVAVCAEGAKFGLTETRLGLIPATIGPYVVGKLGAPMARRVFMSSRIFDAAEAERLGLVARVGAASDLDALVEAEVAPYLACAPGAVAAAKRHLLALAPAIDDAVIAMAAEVLVDRWEDNEAAEGIDAFFEKRKPSWVKG